MKIKLNDQDIKRAKQIAEYPWFKEARILAEGNREDAENGFKLEVEALITKDISYVTEKYVPERLDDKDFLY